ncbi:SCY kinase-related protein (incomplete catalytic triad) [Cyclospora cayetanensis]|uniref:SCY kinase-related protein (Incomplete catalytic triad) n=1 Tax=Cyclospora cayetanensis TaxID=88456 RepID=A0A1D3CV82_9EIME|nr:SCY kinase-related protein (incomplete catalytic triad) [Cyclospora cayetanensis]
MSHKKPRNGMRRENLPAVKGESAERKLSVHMGNPLLKQYHVDRELLIPGTRHARWTVPASPVLSAKLDSLFSIAAATARHIISSSGSTIHVYRGRHAERPGVDVCLFTANLRAPELAALAPDGAALQKLRSLLQQDAQLLQRLRHPRLLQVVDPLQQAKDSWVFCTKPVERSLRQLLAFAKGSPQNASDRQDLHHVASTVSGPSLLEAKCGLLDIAEAISFLHGSGQLLHLNIHPDSVFIDGAGRWQLGGLCFAVERQAHADSEGTPCVFSFGSSSAGLALAPPLRYSAPELSSAFPPRASEAADVFSFSLLAAEILGARGLPTCKDGELQDHQQQCSTLAPLRASSFPPDSLFQQAAAEAAATPATELLQLLSRGLDPDPLQRPSIEAFLGSSFLLSTETKALRFLACLHEKEQQQQQQFLLGLLPLLQQRKQLQQSRVLRLFVLKPLLSALKFPAVLPALLPNILWAVKTLEDDAFFRSRVWPQLEPLLTAKEIQVEAVVILISEFENLVKPANEETRSKALLPFLLKCLDIRAPEIQQAALTAVQTSHGVFDYTAHRTLFLPRVLSLIANAESSAVRLAGLEALRSMGSSFDRDTVEAQILPVLLQAFPNTDASCCYMCVCALPASLVNDGLSLEDYRKIDAAIKAIIRRVDEDRQRHFAVKAEQQSAVDAALPSSQETPSLPAVSLEGLLATASLPVPPSLSLPSGKGGLLHSLPTPPKPPPPPPASTCLTPQYASNSTSGLHRQHQGALSEAAEQMLPSLNARLPEHKFPAPRGNTSGAEKNSPSRASEECSELDMILAAASAAIPQNKPS